MLKISLIITAAYYIFLRFFKKRALFYTINYGPKKKRYRLYLGLISFKICIIHLVMIKCLDLKKFERFLKLIVFFFKKKCAMFIPKNRHLKR